MIRFACIVLCMIPLGLLGQEIALTGVNRGKGIYIQNPYRADSGEFCIQEIFVNGKKVVANIKLTAIYLPFHDVQKYSPVSIHIKHKDYCKPRILNPEDILYHSSFKYDSVVVNDSLLQWYTKGDRETGHYSVEKLEGDIWESIHSIDAKGRFEGAQYVFFPEHDDGGNKYRIKYSLPDGRHLYSEEIEYFSFPETITFSPHVVKDQITLSRATDYEILNREGETILQGNGRVIPLRRLQPGDYSIVLQGEANVFTKK